MTTTKKAVKEKKTELTKKTRKTTTTKRVGTRKKTVKKEEPAVAVAETETIITPVSETVTASAQEVAPAPVQEATTTTASETVETETQEAEKKQDANTEEKATEAKAVEAEESKAEEKTIAEAKTEEPQNEEKPAQADYRQQQKIKPVPPLPQIRIDNIVDLVNAPHRQIIISDQQIQTLSLEEAGKRFRWIEGMLAWVLNYDVVISDTNIWIELLVGHTSSHSDPRVNARLLFERQLEFISKLVKFRGGRFMMMSETYEEIDRFASQQAPANYKDVDFTDEAVCRNVAARLAKRLILSQQRENRLRIEGIGAESHHAAFADPAIIRRTVEMFASGKKVLLLTNDASVAIRSMGMCDDLQRHNNIDDATWDEVYAPLRPMVITMDDLKILDSYTRMYHFLQMAAGKQWMEDVPRCMEKRSVQPLELWMDGFKSGDKHPEHYNNEQQKQASNQAKQQKQNSHNQQQKHNNSQAKQQTSQTKTPTVKPQPATAAPQPAQPEPQQKAKAAPTQNAPAEKQPQKEVAEQKPVVATEQPIETPEVSKEKPNNSEAQPTKKRQYRRKPQRNKNVKAE